MLSDTFILILLTSPTLVVTTNLIEDPLDDDSDLEVAHLYKDQWPTGIAVSSSGRKFSCYPAGLDEDNVNNGLNNAYQVAELTSFDTETPFPNEDFNNPPGGAVDTTGPFPVTKGLSNHLLGVESVVIDFLDTLWLLDNGRVIYRSVLLPSSQGGPKLVSIDLATNTTTHIYTFPADIVKPTSYLADVRFDSTRRFAYISDSSPEANNAIVVLDLETSDSWRVLERDFTVTRDPNFLAFVYGSPFQRIQRSNSGQPVGIVSIQFGVNGLALSPDLDVLYYSVAASRNLFSVPTALLRNRTTPATDITSSVRNLGENGVSSGIIADSEGTIYAGSAQQDGVSALNTTRGFVTLFARDKRINFVSRFSIADDGFMYLTVSQLNLLPSIYPGPGAEVKDRRQRPFVLFRIKLPGGATKGPGS